jgi:hypothetical protein
MKVCIKSRDVVDIAARHAYGAYPLGGMLLHNSSPKTSMILNSRFVQAGNLRVLIAASLSKCQGDCHLCTRTYSQSIGLLDGFCSTSISCVSRLLVAMLLANPKKVCSHCANGSPSRRGTNISTQVSSWIIIISVHPFFSEYAVC